MTSPGPLPLTDPGNTLLSGSPFTWAIGRIPMASGEAAVFTLRTVDCTLTLGATRDQLSALIADLTALRDSLSASGLVTGVPASLIRP